MQIMRNVLLAALIAFQFCCAQAEEAMLSEAKVKLAIEEASRLEVCSNKAQLAILGIDLPECLDSIPVIASACWLAIDKLAAPYRIPASEDGKGSFFDIAYVFNKCVRSELLEKAGRDSAKSQD